MKHTITLALFLFLSLTIILTAPVKAREGQFPEPYSYTSFHGEHLTLYPYPGQKVALLVPSPDLDEATLYRIVYTFDAAYDYYHSATGREPGVFYNYNGLASIAVVPSTCGAGCAYLGATGIELLDTDGYSAWDILYEGVLQRDEYDQVTFYELGRNFWFYGDEIEYKGSDNTGSITTGYAVFMRFMAMEAAGVTPGPYNGIPFTYFESEVKGMLDRYLSNATLNWDNTLRVGQAPANPIGLGATDLFASFLFELRQLFGNSFIEQLWKEVAMRPDAGSTQQAVDNFILASSAASGRNLTTLFTTWRWPVSNEAVQEAQSRFGAPFIPSPDLQVNYSTGSPNSTFTFTGSYYSPNTPVPVTINGAAVGTVTSNDAGWLRFTLIAPADSSGLYFISLGSGSPVVTTVLVMAGSPTRSGDGSWPQFVLPTEGIQLSESVFLPSIQR